MSSSQDVIDRVDHCDVLQNLKMLEIPLDYIFTKSGKVNTALEQDRKIDYGIPT